LKPEFFSDIDPLERPYFLRSLQDQLEVKVAQQKQELDEVNSPSRSGNERVALAGRRSISNAATLPQPPSRSPTPRLR
jgi:hypothetical protein